MDQWAGVVLAAGDGVRMRSRLTKVLHRVCGKQLVRYPVDLMNRSGISRVVVVVSPGNREAVRSLLGDTVEYVTQPAVKGTGDAVGRAAELLRNQAENILELTADAMQGLRGKAPAITVCGLNPHAGEKGLIGQGEEESVILPAIERAREKGIEVIGPLPADTAFLPQRRAETDAYVCMYHDQALIPLKMLAFDTAVNMTLGLPFIRTSVDHGTALDIAWQGKASANSLREAILLAAGLAIPCA